MTHSSYPFKLLVPWLLSIVTVALLLATALTLFYLQQLTRDFDDREREASRQLTALVEQALAREDASPPATANRPLVLAVVETTPERRWLAVYRTLLGTVLITLAICLLGAVAVAVIARRVFAPLDRIHAALKHCAQGNPNPALSRDNNGLFTGLAASIDLIGSRLSESQQATREHAGYARDDPREHSDYADRDPRETVTPAAAIDPELPRQRTPGPRILAVDDNPANLQLISELVEHLGGCVTRARDGREAVALFEAQAFDLIFMDIQMPGMDGLATTQRIRERESDTPGRRIPIVALTANAVTDQKAELLLAGLDDYLSKPVSEAKLVDVIRRWAQPEVVAPSSAVAKTAAEVTAMNAAANSNVDVPRLEVPRLDVTPLNVPRSDVPPSDDNGRDAPVDIQLCLKLSSNKPLLARDMLGMLLETLPEERRRIERYFQQRAFADLETTVHTLRGGASYCGVPKLKTAAAALEDSLRQQSFDKMEDTVTDLLSAIDQLLAWQNRHDLDALFGVEETA